MKEQLKNLAQPENRRYIPAVVVGLGIAAIQLAVREITRPYTATEQEKRMEDLIVREEMARIEYYSTGGEDEQA